MTAPPTPRASVERERCAHPITELAPGRWSYCMATREEHCQDEPPAQPCWPPECGRVHMHPFVPPAPKEEKSK